MSFNNINTRVGGKQNDTLTMETIQSIEEKLGYNIPVEYKDFLLTANKDKYKYKQYCRIVVDGYKTDGQIDHFCTIETFWTENKYRSFLDEFQDERMIPRDYLESEFLYIIANCDNQCICMALNGTHKGKIYSSDNGDFGIVFQAESLSIFLDSLYDANYLCTYEQLIDAAQSGNISLLQELIELKDGYKILNRSSYCDREIFDIAYNLTDKRILKYLISKGYRGYDRYKLYKLEN